MPCVSWICGNCRSMHPGSVPSCPKCGLSRRELRHSTKAVVYRNPATGEHRTPARSDVPMPEVYACQGFVREEIDNMSAFERETGLVHEASNYNQGGATAERDLAAHCEPLPIKGLDAPSNTPSSSPDV